MSNRELIMQALIRLTESAEHHLGGAMLEVTMNRINREMVIRTPYMKVYGVFGNDDRVAMTLKMEVSATVATDELFLRQVEMVAEWANNYQWQSVYDILNSDVDVEPELEMKDVYDAVKDAVEDYVLPVEKRTSWGDDVNEMLAGLPEKWERVEWDHSRQFVSIRSPGGYRFIIQGKNYYQSASLDRVPDVIASLVINWGLTLNPFGVCPKLSPPPRTGSYWENNYRSAHAEDDLITAMDGKMVVNRWNRDIDQYVLEAETLNGKSVLRIEDEMVWMSGEYHGIFSVAIQLANRMGWEIDEGWDKVED